MNPTPDQPTTSKLQRASVTELLVNSTLCNFYDAYNHSPDNGYYIMSAKNGAMLFDWLMLEKAFEIPQEEKNRIWKEEQVRYKLNMRKGIMGSRRKWKPEEKAKDLEMCYKTGLVEWQLAKLKKEDITITVIFPKR